jgi:hypothetical protein
LFDVTGDLIYVFLDSDSLGAQKLFLVPLQEAEQLLGTQLSITQHQALKTGPPTKVVVFCHFSQVAPYMRFPLDGVSFSP